MTDTPTPTPVTAKKFQQVAKGIVLSGWVICMVASIIIVLSAVYLMVMHPEVKMPDTLREWASVVIGFMFGNMMTMIKDFVEKNE